MIPDQLSNGDVKQVMEEFGLEALDLIDARAIADTILRRHWEDADLVLILIRSIRDNARE